MVAGRQVFHHPSIQGRHYILDKLTAFHREHDTGMAEVLRDLQAAVGQMPQREHAAEAGPLHEELPRSKTAGGVVPNCWATSCRWCWRAWGSAWYNRKSQGSRPPPHQVQRAENAYCPQGANPKKSMALSRITNA